MVDRQLKELKDDMKELKDTVDRKVEVLQDMIGALFHSLPQQLYDWNRQQQQAQSAQSSEGEQRTA